MIDFDKVKTIADFLRCTAESFPNKIGLRYRDESYTYREIRKRAERVTNLVGGLTKRGEVVALLLPNEPGFIFSYFGILGAGRTILLLPGNISDKNLLFQIEKVKPKVIISSEKYEQKLDRVGIINRVKYININLIKSVSGRVFHKVVNEDELALIIFTSGTTAEPKGVKLKHKNAVAATRNMIEFLKWNNNDVDVNILQLSHSFGLGNLHCIFAVGGTMILFQDAINLKAVFRAIKDYKATTFAAVPATLRLIIDNFWLEFKKGSSFLRFIQTNTAPLEKSMIKTILTELPKVNFNYYYGLTEASRSSFITFNNNLDKLSSVGRASFNTRLKIVDEKDEELSVGKIGEICIKGEQVIDEYWGDEAGNNKIKKGWFHTRDVGYMDKDGFLYIAGRLDEVINVSGEKVLPIEIEEVVGRVPGVLEAVAVGVPDRVLGEVVKVLVVVDEKKFDLENVNRECRKNLESYKVPRQIQIVKEILRTENGKIRRAVLKTVNR